jgi:hypothetical protein
VPELKNTRHELFCHALLEGMSASDAYVRAGYKRNDGNAGRLNRNEQIQSRLAELKGTAANAAAMDKAWVLKQLKRVFEMSVGERKVGDREEGDYAFNPAAAKGVLELVGKEQGMFVDQKAVWDRRIEDLTDAELDFLLGELQRRVGAVPGVDEGTGAPRPYH